MHATSTSRTLYGGTTVQCTFARLFVYVYTYIWTEVTVLWWLLCCVCYVYIDVDFAVVAVDNEGKPHIHKRTPDLFLIHSQAHTLFSTSFQIQAGAHTNGQKVGAHTQGTQVTNIPTEYNTPLTLPIRDAMAHIQNRSDS